MPTGGRFDVITYDSNEGGTAIEGVSVITQQGTAPTIICTNGFYLYLFRKVLNFTSVADANYWASLQGTQGEPPECEIWLHNEVQPRYTESMTVEVVGASCMIEARFSPRADVGDAFDFNNRFDLKALNIISDISPDTVNYYYRSV